MTKEALSGAVAALLAALLVACGYEEEKVFTPPATATEPVAAWTLYHDSEGKFSISYPAGWLSPPKA